MHLLVYVPLAPMQKFWYRRLLTKTDSMTIQEIFSGSDRGQNSTHEKNASIQLDVCNEAIIGNDEANQTNTTNTANAAIKAQISAAINDQNSKWKTLMSKRYFILDATSH